MSCEYGNDRELVIAINGSFLKILKIMNRFIEKKNCSYFYRF